MRNIIRLTAVLALTTIGVLGTTAAPAHAHSAVGGASCAGAVLDAGSYDGSQANTYSLTVDQNTVAGTFGVSIQQTVPVPQDGAVHTWAYSVEAADGSFHFADSGQVGPCGTPPVVVDECPDLTGDQPGGTACTTPPDQVVTADTTSLDCDAQEQVTTTTTTTTPFVFEQATQTWVPGTPVVSHAVSSVPVQPRDCNEPPVDECPGEDGVQNGDQDCGVDHTNQPPTDDSSVSQPTAFTATPTVLPAAGAAAVTSSPSTWSRLIGMGALAGGFVLLAGLVGLALRRRLVLA